MKILTAFHSPQEELSSSSRGIEQTYSENAKPWAKVFQAVLSVKLPWCFMNNQGPHSLSFPNLDLHLEPCIGKSFLTGDHSGWFCVEICISSEKCKWQTSQSISSVLLLEFKRLSSFWSTTRRSDLLLQYVFTEYLWCGHCLLYNHGSMTFPGSRMFPQYWDCSSSTSGTPDDTHCLHLPIDLACYRYVWGEYET